MSPRPFKPSKVNDPPVISGFKPYGKNKNPYSTGIVFLHLEEYEAIRLCDYEMLDHQQAAGLMVVSRPTFTRIYARARKKIAEAFVQGKQIVIEGGKIYYDSEWYSCKSCGCYFNNPDKQVELKECPLCRSIDFERYEPDNEETAESPRRCTDKCICSSCGYTTNHHSGYPCRNEICPECGSLMIRREANQISI